MHEGGYSQDTIEHYKVVPPSTPTTPYTLLQIPTTIMQARLDKVYGKS